MILQCYLSPQDWNILGQVARILPLASMLNCLLVNDARSAGCLGTKTALIPNVPSDQLTSLNNPSDRKAQ